jgi:ATP-dependent RNA helicase DDX56/DBP9
LNAELPENSRRHILESYDKGLFDYLIATDEAVNDESNEEEFGVARGVDFRGVQTVINVDVPEGADAYVHRVGRTARAGAAGSAVSIITKEESNLLKEIQEAQPKRTENGETLPQPALLALDISELEGFRYRVDGMRNAIKKKAIKGARLKDLKNEMLNSEKLQAHFQDHPRDLQLLKHDAPLRSVQVQRHLATVPSYLLPSAALDEQKAVLGVDDNDEDERVRFNNKKRKKFPKKNKGKKRKRDPLL